jgi:hypothetical protein
LIFSLPPAMAVVDKGRFVPERKAREGDCLLETPRPLFRDSGSKHTGYFVAHNVLPLRILLNTCRHEWSIKAVVK